MAIPAYQATGVKAAEIFCLELTTFDDDTASFRHTPYRFLGQRSRIRRKTDSPTLHIQKKIPSYD